MSTKKPNSPRPLPPTLHNIAIVLGAYFLFFMAIRYFVLDRDVALLELILGSLFSSIIFTVAFNYPGYLQRFISGKK